VIVVGSYIAIDKPRLETITKRATFISQEEFIATYFDTVKYWFTLHNRWLSLEGSLFQLQLPLGNVSYPFQAYRLLSQPSLISNALRLLPKAVDFVENLERNGIVPFCSFSVFRETYTYHQWTIQIAKTDFDYRVGYVFRTVRSVSQASLITKDLELFLQAFGLGAGLPYSVAVEHLRLHRRLHFRSLVQAGVVK
jgi:hypothetical protein